MHTDTVEPVFRTWSERIRVSDRLAYSELFQAMHLTLLRYAWRITGDEHAAQDVVQEVFLKVWRIREELDPSRSLKSLLYTMVRNLALNYNRSQQRVDASLDDVAYAQPTSDPSVEQMMAASQMGTALHTWIAEMPPRRREAFQLSRFEGLSHDEIANIMNLTPRTVNTHIVLALKYLRNRLSAFDQSQKAS